MDYGLFPYRFPQGRIARPHCSRHLLHRILRDGTLSQPDARQFFQNGRHFSHRHSVPVVQQLRRRSRTRSHSVGGRSLLACSNIRVLSPH
jgi:hypothetical protein